MPRRTLAARDIFRASRKVPTQPLPRALPRTRAECVDGPRPCPYVSCRYHLFLEVTSTGSIAHNVPGKELHDLQDTCALDVAERDGVTLGVVAEKYSISCERVRQIEERALRRLAEALRAEVDDDLLKVYAPKLATRPRVKPRPHTAAPADMGFNRATLMQGLGFNRKESTCLINLWSRLTSPDEWLSPTSTTDSE